jgi:hypothetical protein
VIRAQQRLHGCLLLLLLPRLRLAVHEAVR